MAERMGPGDVFELVKTYAKQETIEPLKPAGKWLGFGVAGSLLLMLAGISLTMALLRVLQEETGSTFTGNLSWAPYSITLVAVGVAIGLLITRIMKKGL